MLGRRVRAEERAAPIARAAPGRASAARRRARPTHSFTISRPRAPPSSPGIQTASRRRQPRIFRLSLSAALGPSVPGREEGQGGGRTEQLPPAPASPPAGSTPVTNPPPSPQPQPPPPAATSQRFFGFLANPFAGGVVGLGKHICALNPLPFLLFVFCFFVFCLLFLSSPPSGGLSPALLWRLHSLG